MKRANIATARNNLSKLIDEVRNGETILIVNRDVPVARLEPAGSLDRFSGRIAALVRDGTVSIPATSLDVEGFLARDKVSIKQGGAVEALVSERDAGL